MKTSVLLIDTSGTEFEIDPFSIMGVSRDIQDPYIIEPNGVRNLGTTYIRDNGVNTPTPSYIKDLWKDFVQNALD